MTTIVITKQELFDLVNQETVYLSDPVGAEQDNAIKRLADVLPMTEDDRDFFNVKLYEAGVRILNQLAFNVEGVDFPYSVTDDTDPFHPNSIVYKFNLYNGANELVVLPLVQQYVAESLIKYIVLEWLKVKGYTNYIPQKTLEFENSLSEIKSSLMYGQRAKKKYVTL